MIKEQVSLIMSPFMAIYDAVVPKDNMLRQINELVDFRFVMSELKDKYCLDNGRNAIPPIRMFKYLLLKVIFDISDVDVVERSKYDMSFKYFLDMAPEDPVIDPSSLTKFRKLRLKDVDMLDLLINKTVEIAMEKGIIKSKSIIVDATHSQSRYNKKSPQKFLSEKSKLLRKSVYQIDEKMKDQFPTKPVDEGVVTEIEYTRKIIEIVENNNVLTSYPKVKEKLNYLKEIVEDYEDEIFFSDDPDAKTGYKSEDHSFFGYKTHIAMSQERIITAAVVTTGEDSDGKHLKTLLDNSIRNGMEVKNVIGDMAYSGKENIIYAQNQQIKLVSKINPLISNGFRSEEDKFEFNKDADMYVCPAGHLATRKAKTGRKNVSKNQVLTYYFDIEKCKRCPLRDGCYRQGAKSKSYSISIKSDVHKAQMEFQESDYFKDKAKERYKIEAKNSELKNRHGYNVANSSGLLGMKLQGAMTIFAVNLKRIITLSK